MKSRRGQGAVEYIMLIGGVLLIVVLIFVLLRGMTTQTGNETEIRACKTNLVADQACYYQQDDPIPVGKFPGDWNPCGKVDEAKYNKKDASGDYLNPPLCGEYVTSFPALCGAVGLPPGFGELFCGAPPK